MSETLFDSTQAAVRLVFDSVSYSNPLPEWLTPVTIDYADRERVIGDRMRSYLSGRTKPMAATPILVPRRNTAPKQWVVPSIDDQIVLQACSLRLMRAAEAARKVDYSRVFSYEPNRDPNRLAFTSDPAQAWKSFREETERRVAGRQMLQFDLQAAFPSVDGRSFIRFFGAFATGDDEMELLALLLRALNPQGTGLPLINDSVFYLGNVFLSVVDEIVAEHSTDFIRFVDDYRIFDDSRDRLERLYETLGPRLREIGFRMNPAKTKVTDDGEHARDVEAARRSLHAERKGAGDETYGIPLVVNDVPQGEALAAVVTTAARDARMLTEGMGRFLMQSVRRLSVLQELMLDVYGAWDAYVSTLEEKADRTALNDILLQLSRDDKEEWRFVWLSYIAKDVGGSHPLAPFLTAVDDQGLSTLARCWLENLRGHRPRDLSIDAWHHLPYAEAGRTLYGV